MSGAIFLSKFFSIPLFQVGILFFLSIGIWFLITDERSSLKKKIFNFSTDALYYFLLTAFGLNIFFNFTDIIQEPYQAILFSNKSSWLALLLISSYLFYRERKKRSLSNTKKQKYIDHTINLFLILGLANHLFYYYKYQNLNSVIFILIYFILYLLKDQIKSPKRNEWTLIILAILHAVMMYFFSSTIIYYHIVFYPYQIISLLLIMSIFVLYFRRDSQSKQK